MRYEVRIMQGKIGVWDNTNNTWYKIGYATESQANQVCDGLNDSNDYWQAKRTEQSDLLAKQTVYDTELMRLKAHYFDSLVTRAKHGTTNAISPSIVLRYNEVIEKQLGARPQ